MFYSHKDFIYLFIIFITNRKACDEFKLIRKRAIRLMSHLSIVSLSL